MRTNSAYFGSRVRIVLAVCALAFAFVPPACAVAKPLDQEIIGTLKDLSKQIPDLYLRFKRDPVPKRSIFAIRKKLELLEARSKAWEGKGSRLSKDVVAVQDAFGRAVSSRGKEAWTQAAVDADSLGIRNAIKKALGAVYQPTVANPTQQ